jgi:DNA-directed RNA polymerase alpha subunit
MSLKDKISNVTQTDKYISFTFNGNCREAAELRRQIKNNIYFYLINKVVFYKNTSTTPEEFLATRLGLLIPQMNNNIFKGHVNVTGPKMVRCSDISNLQFIYDMPIIYLREEEQLVCDVIMEKDCGKTHQKWNPVAGLTFCKAEVGFTFTCELLGCVSFEEILEQL